MHTYWCVTHTYDVCLHSFWFSSANSGLFCSGNNGSEVVTKSAGVLGTHSRDSQPSRKILWETPAGVLTVGCQMSSYKSWKKKPIRGISLSLIINNSVLWVLPPQSRCACLLFLAKSPTPPPSPLFFSPRMEKVKSFFPMVHNGGEGVSLKPIASIAGTLHNFTDTVDH